MTMTRRVEPVETTKLSTPDDIYPGPVLASTLAELKAVAQEFGANILEIPDGTPVTLELAGPATIILAYPAEVEPGKEKGRLVLSHALSRSPEPAEGTVEGVVEVTDLTPGI